MPINKEELLAEFLKSFKIAINGALLYTKSHPFFMRYIEDLKLKIDPLFGFLNPLRIVVTPNSLIISDKSFSKTSWYDELIKILHRRKIKSIEFKKGITIQELAILLDRISLPPQEILKRGGVDKIFSAEENAHFAIEELDYSSLLTDKEGQGYNEAWFGLVESSINRNDIRKINEFADNFQIIMAKLNVKDLVNDQRLQKSMHDFLNYLKTYQKEKFNKCCQIMLETTLKYSGDLNQTQLTSLQSFFMELDDKYLADVLWNKLSIDDDFGPVGLRLFSQLTNQDKHKTIISNIFNKTRDVASAGGASKIKDKIEKLFSSSDNIKIPEIYQNMLSALRENSASEDKIGFDRDQVEFNYRRIILNLIMEEKNNDALLMFLNKVMEVWDVIVARQDFEYLKNLTEVSRRKVQEDPSCKRVFKELDSQIVSFVEKAVFEQPFNQGIKPLIQGIEKSSSGYEFYLDKIFKERKFNQFALSLFFRFFPGDLEKFCNKLEQSKSDIDLLVNLIEDLKQVNSSVSLDVLKYLYFSCNEYIKIEALRAMQECSNYNKEFLLSIIAKENAALKKVALQVIMRDKELVKEALSELLDIPSPFGKNNGVLIENISVVEDIELKEAGVFLASFSKKRFFWNRALRIKAKEVLQKWNVGKN
ncbi:MAG: hypothetical protein ABIH27_06145 [Candidatus Omnitrophota bacterium]